MKNGDYILVVAPEWFKGKRYRGRYCYEHHLVWEQETGCVVPDGCVIHHKDGNKHNNSIDNLQMMASGTHKSIHAKGERFYRIRCPQCGKVFDRKKRQCGYGTKLVFCSRQCSGKMYARGALSEDVLRKAKMENVIEEFVLG